VRPEWEDGRRCRESPTIRFRHLYRPVIRGGLVARLLPGHLFFCPTQVECLPMCGRFARYSLSRELERYFNAHPASFELQPNYNVAPTQEIPVIAGA
jgi:hypothetical protein